MTAGSLVSRPARHLVPIVLALLAACKEPRVQREREPDPRWHVEAGRDLPEHVLLDALLESHAGLQAILAVADSRGVDDDQLQEVVRRLASAQATEMTQMESMLASRLRDQHARQGTAADRAVAESIGVVASERFGSALRSAIVAHHGREIATIDSANGALRYLEVQVLVRRIREARVRELGWLEVL